MRIYGIDFTSRPRHSKPITCLECDLTDDRLQAGKLTEWTDFDAFDAALRRPGPWIAGIDFPFGQARRFIETIGWPRSWQGYVDHAVSLGRSGFRTALDAYPGILARKVIGRRSCKQETRAKQTAERAEARKDLLKRLTAGAARSPYGLHVNAPAALTDDPSGDQLDALLCAIQAAWAWTLRNKGFGIPEPCDRLEGWIADPATTTN